MPGVILFLALLLAGAAVHKALSWQRLSVSAARLVGGTPVQGVLTLAVAGTMEAMAAIALLTGPMRPIGAVLAALIWIIYTFALLRRRGETLDCGCDFSFREKPVGHFAILRPAALACLALAALILPSARWSIDAPFVAAAMLALYVAAAELAALSSFRKGALR